MWKQKLSKKAIWFGIQILVVLILLPGCFQKEKIVYSLFGEELVGREVQGADGVQVFGEQFSLEPGVYQVRVWANVLENQQMFVEVSCAEESFRAIRTNAVPIFAGDEYIDFEVYVSDHITSAYVALGLTNMNASGLVELDIYKTAQGNWVMLFTFAVVLGCINFMLLFRKGIIEGKVTKKHQIVFWILFGGIMLAFIPCLTDTIMIVDDTIFHLSRIAYIQDSILNGSRFPVRVQSTWLYDHGYACSLFYGDLFLYIPAFLRIIGFPLMTAYKMFILLIMIATACVAYHCINKCVRDEYAALFGSMAYILAPYRLTNVYIRNALGESLAMVFLPLICCGMYLLLTENADTREYSRNKWYLIWGVSGVVLCHNISLEMIALFLTAVCICACKKVFRKNTFIQLLQSVGWVLILNAWYLIPFLHMLSMDSYKVSLLEKLDLSERALSLIELFQFLPTRESMSWLWGHVPAILGAGQIVILIMYFLYKKKDRNCTFFAILSLVALILCTKLIPWDTLRDLPVIGYFVNTIQFPWRFMTIATICIVFFDGLFYKRVCEQKSNTQKSIMIVVCGVILGTAVYQLNLETNGETPAYLYIEENMGTVGVSGAEYLLEGNEFYEYYYHGPVAEDGLMWSQYKKQGTNVSIKLRNHTEGTRYLEIPLIGYKGYFLKTEKSEVSPYITEERGNHGDLRIAVPAGYQGTVEISYEGGIIFRVAEIISAVSILALIGEKLYRRRKKIQNAN